MKILEDPTVIEGSLVELGAKNSGMTQQKVQRK